MRKGIIIALFGLLGTGSVWGQDIHFSQFNHSPMNLNPALAGHFEGDYRFVGNQRRQWNSITSNPFQTLALSADANEPLFIKNLGAGLSLVNDVTGDSRFRTFIVNLAGSYSWTLPTDTAHTFTPGLQVGFVNRSINPEALSFDSQYNGLRYDPTLPNNENFARDSRSYLSANLGFLWKYQLDEERWLETGVSLSNLSRPQQSFYNDAGIVLDRRLTIHSSYRHPLNDKTELLPSLLFQRQGKLTEVLLGSSVKYTLNDSPYAYRAIRGGAWARAVDAGILSAGLDYDQWFFGLSYDINLSRLQPASRYRGGLEIAVIYILKNTLPERARFKRCPSYI